MNKEANRQPPGRKVATPSRQSRGRGAKVIGDIVPASRQLSTSAALISLAGDVGRLIESARQQVARAANAALTTLYWQIACGSARTC